MLKSLTLNIGSKLVVVVSQFITLSLVNHIIGPEGRGIFTSAVTWSGLFLTLGHLSLAAGITHLSGKNIKNVSDLAKISVLFSFLFGALIILVALGIRITLPALFNDLSVKHLLLAFMVIPFMMLQLYALAIMQVKGNFKAFNILYSLYSLMNLLFIFLAWYSKEINVDILFFINLIAWAFTGIFSLKYMAPYLKGAIPGKTFYSIFFRTSFAAHFGVIVTFIVSRSDILLLNYFMDDKKMVGVYTLAAGFVQILLILPLSIQNILYYQLLGKERKAQADILLRYSRLTFGFMIVSSVALMFLSPFLVNILGGKGFESAIPLFRYFLPGIILYSLPMVLSTQWNLMGIFRQVNIVSISVLLISLLCNWILIPYIGIAGGAITFLIMAFFAFCIHILFVQRYLGKTSLSEILILRLSDLTYMFAFKKKTNSI